MATAHDHLVLDLREGLSRMTAFRAAEKPLPTRDLVFGFRTNLDTTYCLCMLLEQFADRLSPWRPPEEGRALLREANGVVNLAHRFEEDAVFPHLRRKHPRDWRMSEMLSRLEGEHVEDRAYALELLETLEALRERGDPDAETFGYMLRGFFMGLRRHIAFEREHLLPILKNGARV